MINYFLFVTRRQTLKDITDAIGSEYQFIGVDTNYSLSLEETKAKIDDADIVFFEEDRVKNNRGEIDDLLFNNPRHSEKGKTRIYILLLREEITQQIVKKSFVRGFDGVIDPSWEKERILAHVGNSRTKSSTRVISQRINDWIISCNKLALIESRISDILHQMGIRSDLIGYHFLKRGILILFLNIETMFQGAENQIYHVLAIIFHSLSSIVRSNIRYAINMGLERANPDVVEKYFGYSISSDAKTIPPNQFLATLADNLAVAYRSQRLRILKENAETIIFFKQLLKLEYSKDGLSVSEKYELNDSDDIIIF